MRNRIRIESHGITARGARVMLEHTREDGIVVETDISSCFQRAEIAIDVQEASRAKLYAILTPVSVSAELEEVVLTRLKPYTRFRRTRRAWRRVVAWAKRRVARSLTPELQREIATRWKNEHAYSRTRPAAPSEGDEAA